LSGIRRPKNPAGDADRPLLSVTHRPKSGRKRTRVRFCETHSRRAHPAGAHSSPQPGFLGTVCPRTNNTWQEWCKGGRITADNGSPSMRLAGQLAGAAVEAPP